MTALHPRILDRNGVIIPTEWANNLTNRTAVGSCPCGAYLWSTPTTTTGTITWYTARCDTCGHEITAPNGHTLPRGRRPAARGAPTRKLVPVG